MTTATIGAGATCRPANFTPEHGVAAAKGLVRNQVTELAGTGQLPIPKQTGC